MHILIAYDMFYDIIKYQSVCFATHQAMSPQRGGMKVNSEGVVKFVWHPAGPFLKVDVFRASFLA